MRQTYFTIAFIVFNIALSSAVFLQKPMQPLMNIMTEIKALEQDDFGKKLFDTIALQMENKAPLEDVAKLLADLKSDLEKQQDAADKQWALDLADCKAKKAEYENNIDMANGNITEATDMIASLSQQIEQLEAAIANKKKQLEILNAREVKLNKDWDADVAAFQKRKAEHTQVIAALDIILPKLRGIHTNTPKHAKAVLVELAKIGHSNPIGALVQLAMTLDPKALNTVVTKLQAIRDSFAASLEDDVKAQKAAAKSYKNMVTEIQTTRSNVESALETDEQNLASLQEQLKAQQQRLADNQALLESNTAALKAKKIACAKLKATYERTTKKRNEEISVVEKVQEILATRLETMKGYLKQRVNK